MAGILALRSHDRPICGNPQLAAIQMNRFYVILLLSAVACAPRREGPIDSIYQSAETQSWRVDSLNIPVCKLCDDLNMKLNKLFSKEIQLGDILRLHEGRLYHIDMNGDTMSQNKSMIHENHLEIYGSDWVDYADIVEHNDSALILKKAQRITYEVGSEPPPNDLVIYLTRIE